uniref:Uncharacterized protein n=1 Tax=Chlamydomonas euryale TaxID=1486919 RepID=A0A7R9VXZ6_9CHLO|mmetsp:Transcript_6760/g.20815  ORF Transcript_6760/g.20815 Transcript_6760/m.20815 type:complete len:333 (+) Transcript_6760:326-1324(+)
MGAPSSLRVSIAASAGLVRRAKVCTSAHERTRKSRRISRSRAPTGLAAQLEELEALESVYGGVAFDDAEAVAEARAAVAAGLVEGGHDLPVLCGTLRLDDVWLHGSPVSLRFTLPHRYPDGDVAQLSVQCAGPREVFESLGTAVRDAARDAAGTECLLLAVSSLKEEAERHGSAAGPRPSHQPALPSACPVAASAAPPDAHPAVTLVRTIIWFHHIKSPAKRRFIVDSARALGVHGMMKPGFPGLVVAEGRADDVEDFVRGVRALSWQAMQERGTDEEELPRGADVGPALRLCPFRELGEGCMSEMAAACRAAGLEVLFLAALKIRVPAAHD